MEDMSFLTLSSSALYIALLIDRLVEVKIICAFSSRSVLLTEAFFSILYDFQRYSQNSFCNSTTRETRIAFGKFGRNAAI